VAAPLPPVTDSDKRLGQDNILPDQYTAIPGIAHAAWTQLAMDAGARATRWVLNWGEIEVEQGQYNYSAHDPVVAADLAAGLQVQGLLIGAPTWAGRPESRSVPANLYLDWNNPGNYWGQFVYETVSHYLGQIGYWIVWNEPNLQFFWKGTPQDYYQLLKVAYQAAKAADPTAQIMFGGLSGLTNPSFLEGVLTLTSLSGTPTAALPSSTTVRCTTGKGWPRTASTSRSRSTRPTSPRTMIRRCLTADRCSGAAPKRNRPPT
jgi:hypothetical protein